MARHQWLAVGLIALGLGLAVNSLLGPLVTEVIRHRYSQTLLNQAIGLNAVSLLIVAPLAIARGVLTLRGHPAGPVLAWPPAAYAA
jgi:hypothetical protein